MSTDNNSGVETSKVANFFSVTGWWYASAALMLVAGIGLIAILILPTDDPTSDTQPTTPTTPLPSTATQPEATTTATSWDDLGCNGTKGSVELPTLPPKVTWEPLGPRSVPTSPKFGPGVAEGNMRSCYQHTPTGAVLAATNSLVIASLVTGEERVAVLSALITPGPGRDASIATDEVIDPSLAVRARAFRVESCAPDRCNLRLIFALAGGLGYADMSMVWSGGDWLLDGAQVPQGGAVESIPAGYAAWGV